MTLSQPTNAATTNAATTPPTDTRVSTDLQTERTDTALPFQAEYTPYDSETQGQLIQILDTRRQANGLPAGQLLLQYLERKRQDNTQVEFAGPAPEQLAAFLNTDPKKHAGLQLGQRLNFVRGAPMIGCIYIGYEGDTLRLSSHT